MALLQISEPGQSPDPHQRKLAVGIDLGTTHSLVASVISGSTTTLVDEQGQAILPSVVHYGVDHQVTVGRAAIQRQVEDPHNTLSSIKRLMGRSYEASWDALPYQIEDKTASVPAIVTADGPKTAIQVSADILKSLRQRAEATLGGDLSGAVITVPAYFDDAQRQATKDAAQIAGINVLRLINEPTAAALAYGLDSQAEGVHAVYDLGGGTFDISVLRLTAGVFEVLATGGDSALGGDDIDELLVDWLIKHATSGEASFDTVARSECRHLARRIKEQLSDTDHVSACESVAGVELNIEISRADFDALIEPLLKRTLRSVKKALRDAGVSASEVDDVVMVGGSTRIPSVRQGVGALFGSEPLTHIDPDQVVALGAALQADILVGNRQADDVLLLDVIPLSLGLEMMGGLVEKVIPRNTTIPASYAQEFTTFKDGQTAMSIHVLQGEREMVDDCRSLAKFELRGIPPLPAGVARIEVRFQVDADGLLSVSAREQETGTESQIQVKPAYGLEDGDIERMIRESFEYAEGDLQARLLQEQKVEADRCLESLQQALKVEGNQYLNADELAQLHGLMTALRDVKDSDDAGTIKAAIETLNKASEPFAARRMNASIQQALSGQSVEQL